MKNLGFVLLLILFSVLPLSALIHSGLPITHDGQDHIARIANFYLSLSEGNIIPRWASNLNWGYGHPILMFLYPLPSYFASMFHIFGLSLVDSVKAVFGVSYILSALFMFLWLKQFLGKVPALTASIIYIYAPYRFVDLYVRGAIGEHVAFIFLPLICYFILKTYITKKNQASYFLGLCLASAGLILSHNAISLMFFPFVLFYIVYLFFIEKKLHLFILSIIGVFYGFLLSSFFWIPAFIEGKYTLRDIVTGSEALTRFVKIKDLIYSSWSFGGTGSLSVQLGLVEWMFILFLPLSLFLLFKRGKTEKGNLIFLFFVFIFLLISLFFMLDISRSLWEMVTIFQKFQFPWRFLSISVFFASVIAGIVAYSFKDKNIQKIILVLTVLFSIFLTKDYWKAKGYTIHPDSFYSTIYNGTTDTGESAPIWSVRFMEKRPVSAVEVIAGKAEIKKLIRSTTKRSYEINVIDSARIKENTLYFPGWKVFIDGKEYKNIEFQDPNNRGLITFGLEPGKHIVNIVFLNTKLREIFDFVSLFSLITLALFGVAIDKKWLKN